MKKKPNILIIGPSGVKRKLAKTISDRLNIKYTETTEILCKQVIYPHLSGFYGNPECFYHNKCNDRKLWGIILNEYNKDNSTRFIDKVLSQSDIYVGLISLKELTASLNKGLFDTVIYVLQDESKKKTTLDISFADLYIKQAKNKFTNLLIYQHQSNKDLIDYVDNKVRKILLTTKTKKYVIS